MTDSVSWAQPPDSSRVLHGSTEASQWREDPDAIASAIQTDPSARVGMPGASPARVFVPTVQRCPKCDGTIDFDGYCEQCGAKAPTIREHYEESPSPTVAGVSDRGARHESNEDALSIRADQPLAGSHVLVVCDGVSSSDESSHAAMAAANQAADFLASAEPWVQALNDGGLEALEPFAAAAVESANEAVKANSDLEAENPASCTIAIGLAAGEHVAAVTLGDSRVYWIPDTGEPLTLSRDHSVAQQEIDQGADPVEAEQGVHGHIITRWLGRDAPDLIPNIRLYRTTSSGWFMVCTDGLWNYASDPEAMADLVRAFTTSGHTQADRLAKELIRWANDQGGADNITVALARIENESGAASPVAGTPTVKTRPSLHDE